MVKFEYKCECSQTTYFAFEGGVWVKDHIKHGTCSDAISCLNCGKPIQQPKQAEDAKPIEIETKTEPLVLPNAEPKVTDNANKKHKKQHRR